MEKLFFSKHHQNLTQEVHKHTGFCRIFATGMFQTSSKCYDRAVLLWSRPIVLATTLPNKEGSWVLGLQGSVAKILQNPVVVHYFGS